MSLVHLADRAVIRAEGPDAEALLQNTLTLDLNQLAEGEARPGALLTPQGKIMFDFVISRAGEQAFRLDCRRDIAEDFIRRLTFLRVRAKVNFSLPDQEVVGAGWQTDSSASQTDSASSRAVSTGGETDSAFLADCRFPEGVGVFRIYAPKIEANASVSEWDRLRIEHGVAESGTDYELQDAFPHDVLFDFNGGVGLRKGCYVGQEVVSRMHHRRTARRRVVIVEGALPLSPDEREITAGSKPLGQLGTIVDTHALAIVRIDRVAEAKAAGETILAGGVELSLRVPAWADFSLEPVETSAEGN